MASISNRASYWLLGIALSATCVTLPGLTMPSGSQAERSREVPANRGAGAGERFVFTESFDDSLLSQRGWYDGAKFKISNREASSGKGCLEYAWLPGTSIPGSTDVMRRLFEPSESVYLRFQMRLSDGWGWSGRAYHPHLIQFMTTENGKFHGPAGSHLTLYVEPWNGKLRLAAQDIQNKDSPHGLTQGPLRGGYNGTLYDSEQVLFNDSKWHLIEVRFKLNSLDLARDRPIADGIAQAWVDGKPVVDRKDLVFRTSDFPNMKINQLLLAPYFGPGLLPHGQTLWLDELALSK